MKDVYLIPIEGLFTSIFEFFLIAFFILNKLHVKGCLSWRQSTCLAAGWLFQHLAQQDAFCWFHVPEKPWYS